MRKGLPCPSARVRRRSPPAGAPSTFATTQFGSQIAASYGAGVGLLFAADVESMAPAGHAHVPNLQYFMVQQTGSSGAAETRAAIIFKGQRTGVASWLAAPASLGALDFISPQATLAWAAAVKQPTAIIDEIMTMQQYNLFPNATVLFMSDLKQVVRARPGPTPDRCLACGIVFQEPAPGDEPLAFCYGCGEELTKAPPPPDQPKKGAK